MHHDIKVLAGLLGTIGVPDVSRVSGLKISQIRQHANCNSRASSMLSHCNAQARVAGLGFEVGENSELVALSVQWQPGYW